MPWGCALRALVQPDMRMAGCIAPWRPHPLGTCRQYPGTCFSGQHDMQQPFIAKGRLTLGPTPGRLQRASEASRYGTSLRPCSHVAPPSCFPISMPTLPTMNLALQMKCKEDSWWLIEAGQEDCCSENLASLLPVTHQGLSGWQAIFSIRDVSHNLRAQDNTSALAQQQNALTSNWMAGITVRVHSRQCEQHTCSQSPQL